MDGGWWCLDRRAAVLVNIWFVNIRQRGVIGELEGREWAAGTRDGVPVRRYRRVPISLLTLSHHRRFASFCRARARALPAHTPHLRAPHPHRQRAACGTARS